MNKPNLFKFAKSELSQDAFICWLLSWANYPEDKPIHDTARYLINELTENKIDNFEKIKVEPQINHIDITCYIDERYVILIEDKTNTKNHSDQLKRYLDNLTKKYSRENIFPIYFKTGDQSNFKSVTQAGYKLFLRPDFLKVLDFGYNQGVNNDIFNDFRNNLQNIENSVQSYKTLPINEWKGNSWTGFYSALQKHFADANWDYVPLGDFLGFWWSFSKKEYNGVEFTYYLQLEQYKFCFKIQPQKPQKGELDKKSAELVRDNFRKLLFDKAKQHGINISKNGRIGKSMTVAVLNGNYISKDENGVIDLDKTVETLKKIQNMLKEI